VHELLTRTLYYLQVHLLYASIVCGAAWMLTVVPRGSATAKYWIWVATSLNFLLPLGAVLDALWAHRIPWAAPLGFLGDLGVRLSDGLVPTVLGVVWLGGVAVLFARLCVRIRSERVEALSRDDRAAPEADRGFLAQGVPVRFAGTGQAPAVDGLLRPRISLPRGIDRLLSAPELNAVLIHELAHARRRDNLLRLLHEIGQCGLWFHPLVWITGSRLALYRELSCDEGVIERAQGRELVSALAKLAAPGGAPLLQAGATSLIGHRLAQLTASPPRGSVRLGNAFLVALFGAVLAAGVFGTVAHTACCFIGR
jgi:beta-lactamase regulating signal transducer with metallopeptidase domain